MAAVLDAQQIVVRGRRLAGGAHVTCGFIGYQAGQLFAICRCRGIDGQGRDKRNALRQKRDFPVGVRGPAERLAFLRLASIFLAVAMLPIPNRRCHLQVRLKARGWSGERGPSGENPSP